MPNLIHLELYCLINPGARALPRVLSGEGLGSVELLDQERRYKLSLLSFVTLRSQQLKRMILPAGSGTERDADGMIIHTLIVEKPYISTPGDCAFLWDEKVLGSDSNGRPLVLREEVLDAALIRRHEWTELCHTPDSRFIVSAPDSQSKDNILTSEVLHADRKYWMLVDDGAYRMPKLSARKGRKEHSVNEMIQLCASFRRREVWAAATAAAAIKAGGVEVSQEDPSGRAKKAFRLRGLGWSNPDFAFDYQWELYCLGVWVDERRLTIVNEMRQEAQGSNVEHSGESE